MKVEVLPGHSVVTEKKTHSPGESLTLEDADARRLVGKKIVKESESQPAGKQLNVAETVKLVDAAESVEALDALAATDERKGVLDAIAKRRAELEKTE
jgi:hypothetical protein